MSTDIFEYKENLEDFNIVENDDEEFEFLYEWDYDGYNLTEEEEIVILTSNMILDDDGKYIIMTKSFMEMRG